MLDTNVLQVTGRGTSVNFVIDDSAPIETVAQGLHEHLTEHRALYSRGSVAVNVGRRILDREELTRIKEILEKDSGVTVTRFWCAPEVLEQALSESIGFGVGVSPAEAPRRDEAPAPSPREARKSSLREEVDGGGLEQWAAYVLEDTPPRRKRPPQAPAPPEAPQAEGRPPEPGPPQDEAAPEEAPPANEVPDFQQPPEQSAGPAPEAAPAAERHGEPEAPAEAPSEEAGEPEPEPQPLPARPIHPQREMVGLYRGNEALLVKTTCRSGEVIRYAGDVVVLADVNPGAEIIADGDILVFGNLRGLAHAGAGGDIQATIIALNLDTHRLQIGPYTGVAPKSNKRSKSNTSNPRIALVRRRSIYVAPYVGRFAGYSGGTLYDG